MLDRLLTVVVAALLGAGLAACGAVAEEPAAMGPPAGNADVQAALGQLGQAQVLGAASDGVPYFIKGQLGHVSRLSSLQSGEEGGELREALRAIAPVFRLSGDELVLISQSVDEQGHRHLRFQQTLHGLEVVSAQLILHVDAEGRVYAANGSARGGARVSAQAKLAPEAARQAAEAGSGARNATAEEAAPRQVYLRLEGADELRLAWRVRVTGEREGLPADDLLYVDARSGSVLALHPQIHPLLYRRVYSANRTLNVPGTLLRSEGEANVEDADANMQYDRMGETYNCYQQVFGRDSYDGQGAPLVSSVHYSVRFNNAYWSNDLKQLVFGDGDGVQSIELGRDLDVTVHELSHGVTASTSQLVNAGQPGALNESFSDIMAGMCTSWMGNWSVSEAVFQLGETIWTPGIPGDALRYLDDPARDGVSLDYYPDYHGQDEHYSAGISNLVFALLAKGGTHPRGKTAISVAAIGPEKASRIFYKANTDFFTPDTVFLQAQTYTQQAASLLGYNRQEVQAVVDAWQAVGVPYPPQAPVALQNGVPVTGLSNGAGLRAYYVLEVPAGKTRLTFNLSGGTGDADMYVRKGQLPTQTTFDCRPFSAGSTETCEFSNPEAGTWYVMIHAYTAYTGVSLTGTYVGPITVSFSDTVKRGTLLSYGPYNVTMGTEFKAVMTSTAYAELYVRFGSAPTATAYDCRSVLPSESGTCTVTVPLGQSKAYVGVRAGNSNHAPFNMTLNYIGR